MPFCVVVSLCEGWLPTPRVFPVTERAEDNDVWNSRDLSFINRCLAGSVSGKIMAFHSSLPEVPLRGAINLLWNPHPSTPTPPSSLYHNQGFVLSVNWIYFYFYFYMTIRQVNEHICHGTVALLFKCGDDDSSSPEGPPRAQSSFPPRAMCLSPVTTGSVQSHTFSVVQIFPEGGCLQMLTIRLLLTMPNVIHILHIHSSYTIYEV